MNKRAKVKEMTPYRLWMEKGESCLQIPEEYLHSQSALHRSQGGSGAGNQNVAATSTSQNLTEVDAVARLPTEILELIVDYLPVADALLACRASRLWNE